MTRDEMNTFLYLAYHNQQGDNENVYEPKVRSSDEKGSLPWFAMIGAVLLVLLPYLIITF